MTWIWARRFLVFAVLGGILALAGCGGGSRNIVSNPSSNTPNEQAIVVDTGPTAQAGLYPYANGAFTTVTVCVPGTSQCQTIPGVLVDTGSEGLRVLASALGSLPLPLVTQGGNPLGECAPFVGAVTWGPIESADVKIASEKASSVPIQVIGATSPAIFSGVPSPSCTDMGSPEQDLNSLGANGILGIGPFAQDCGPACMTASTNLNWYYSCPNSGCTISTAGINQQVENPVAAFPVDNNGVVIQLPSVPPATAQTSLSGSLIFGIGTQSNNALSGATVYAIDPTTGNISTEFNNTLYSDVSYIDSGSGAIFFLDPTTVNMAVCSDNSSLYCPSANESFTATNVGADGTAGSSFNFVVGNADSLLANTNDGVANGLAGPTASSPGSSDSFDWGLPFFYGRTVFTAIQGAGTPGGPGPYFAY
jgi:hypothetical protein